MLTAALQLPAFRLPEWEKRHWLTSFVLATVFALNLVAGMSILGMDGTGGQAAAKVSSRLPAELRSQTLPAPEPLRFRDVPPQDAVAINASVPVSELPNPAARAFNFTPGSVDDKERAVRCLTQAIYYEAATEPLDGQRAVAQVVLNRVRHPAYPNTVCGVVFQGSERSTGCQFTFTCDGALARAPMVAIWNRARAVAEAALAGYVFKPVGWATHYHTNWVVPYWSSSLVKAANIGTHIFYRWTGGWGTGPAFRNRYAGLEPSLALPRPTVADQKALAAAEAALLDVAAAEQVAADGTAVVPTSVDSFQRAVLRRYEPAKADGIANVIAKQTRSGDAVAQSYRWALMGDAQGAKEPALGKKPEAKKADDAAAPAQPKELEGVRKVESSTAARK
jgi:spore germination cell wall hydrolase CwlJ-like protein